MPEMSLRLPEEWARAVAARVARTIRDTCGQAVDQHSHASDEIDDACDAAVKATLQVLAEEFNGRDPVHDDTALAIAYARGRREMAEEAATKAKSALDDATRMSAILLAAGEMTAQERRTAKAVADMVSARVLRALIANTPEPAKETGTLERVRHLKRGTEYEVLGEAEAQVSIDEMLGGGNPVRLIADGDRVTVYRDPKTGKLWCRFTDEFRDGRFETITPPAIEALVREEGR